MTTPSLLLLGSTDLTLSVANRLFERPIVPLAGVLSPPAEFRISYSNALVRNSRFVDMESWCRERGLLFRRYEAPDDIAVAARDMRADVALLAGWYHLVPDRIRQLFPRGCLSVHASLLPRYRGGAPLNWALLNGDSEAGVSLFELSDSVDHGLLYDQRRFPIAPDDYISDLVRKAETTTLDMLRDTLPRLLDGRLDGRPQVGDPSYSLQRSESDGIIDWRRSAVEIARLVRSVSRPYPGARATLDGKLLTIWRACAAGDAPTVYGSCGQIVRLPELAVPAVVTGAGLLLVEEVEGPDGFDLRAFAQCHQRRFDPSVV